MEEDCLVNKSTVSTRRPDMLQFIAMIVIAKERAVSRDREAVCQCAHAAEC
ncbi:hypothetical protein DPMN_015181 [Dreissena polymorpha]|uniref:Uncharacterized protein n=1 Tax=Dreissena polymorpha TaxID=45954 RepID=A0A9D4S5Y1_DREPO|nr:hypothetical protein DPMN_015181 [Dreissena polymorpha]